MIRKIVIAPDSFKGCASAKEVCEALARGVHRALPEAHVVCVPMADGGEGTVDALVDATGGNLHTEVVTGPLGDKIIARYGILGDSATAVIEMAAASGLPLVPPSHRDPARTTTYGTGELIRAALGRGCRKIILGIGGSATNDGGAGMAQALGARLLNANGDDISWGGLALLNLAHIEVSELKNITAGVDIVVATDVDNPLCGPTGASAVYGPQKGASPEMVKQLDAALARYADIIQRDLGKDVRNVPGAGAAGGLGAGLIAFLDATLCRGVDIVIEAVHLTEKLSGASLVITGEGCIDGQTAFGKTVWGVGKAARQHGIPVVAVAGKIDTGADTLRDEGIDVLFPITEGPVTLEESMRNAGLLLERAAERLTRLTVLLEEHK